MTLLTPEQFAAAQKANFETLFGLTTKAFEGIEKLVELNLQVVKSTLAESQENAQRALSVKDAQEFFALQAGLTQPISEKALSYGRHVYEIVSATQGRIRPRCRSSISKSKTARCSRWSKTSPRTHRLVRKPLSP